MISMLASFSDFVVKDALAFFSLKIFFEYFL